MGNHPIDGGPAFPCIEPTLTGISSDGEERYENEAHGGMTLRDYFAAKALNAILASDWTFSDFGYVLKQGASLTEQYAHCAYELADAMLAARR